jgi:hypothetical protein
VVRLPCFGRHFTHWYRAILPDSRDAIRALRAE